MREPPSSQNRWRIFCRSRASRICRSRADPFRAFVAMSLVGSLTVGTTSLCTVNWTRPSRNGGRSWCTSSVTRWAPSSSKVSSASRSAATPDVTSRFSSHAAWSWCSCDRRALMPASFSAPSPLARARAISCSRACHFSRSPTKASSAAAPPSSS